MKDIKELIYAAVEENALKFQELVNAQLQVRAYDAIEALRPEVGASMFGESSHKKMDDEDEEDENEDEDEIKESVREYLNQDGTGKSTEGYDDAGTFDRQTAEKHAAKHGGKVVPDPSGKHLVVLRGKKKMQEALHPNQQKIDVVDDEKIDAKDFAKLRKMKKMKEIDEEVAPSTSQFHVLVHKSSSANVEKAHHATSGAGNKNFRPGQGLARIDKPGGRHDPTGGDHHVIHAPDSATHENLRKNLSDYGARATIVDTHTGKREDVHEEVKQVNERSREELMSQIKGLKKPAIKHGFDWPTNDSTDKTSTKDLKSFHKSARSVIKQGLKAGQAKSDVQEVAMPQNAADWQAMINHQIKVTGHPVATDAQFRATTVGKDTSKIASLEPGEDKLQYATAQGGTVKQ